jgi:undecaprenyl-diphosphatase
MTLLHALVLGIIEGLTEFLPVSSTAHLVLAGKALGLGKSEFAKSFDIIIQFGAILSVVVLYWRKFLNVDVIKKLAIAFIPTGIIGLTVYKALKSYLLDNVTVILAALVLGGIALILFDRRQRPDREEIDFSEISYGRALLIGLFQSIAIVPGVSRSAATIVGGSLIGISKRTIVEFSFMLAVPTMAAATLYDLYKSHGAIDGNYAALGVGFVVSFLTAIVAIKSFLAFIKKRSFAAFGWYRIALAIVYFLVFGRGVGE